MAVSFVIYVMIGFAIAAMDVFIRQDFQRGPFLNIITVYMGSLIAFMFISIIFFKFKLEHRS
jgi:uncharacterized membrane protein YcjF (UPF0283 family)